MKCFSTAAATFIIPSINVQGCIHVYNYYLLDNLTLLTIHNNDHFVSCHRFCFKIYLILLNIYIANPALFWLLFTYNIFPSFHFVFFLNFLFYIGVQLINNVVIVSDAQQSNSAIHIHVSILPQTPLPSRLPHNIEQSSLCYTVGPCWLSFLNIAVCTCQPQTP